MIALLVADTVIDVPAWVAVIGFVLGTVGTIAASVAVARQQAIKASLATIIQANEELRKANQDLKNELQTEREERVKLESRLELVTGSLANQIVTAVANALHERKEVR